MTCALVPAVGLVLPAASSASAAETRSKTFTKGANQPFTVPEGVTSLDITAIGESGRPGKYGGGAGGKGGVVTGTIPVKPGDVLYVNVATGGGKSVDGGDGGGSSDIRTCDSTKSDCTLSASSTNDPRLIVAGGGGGGASGMSWLPGFPDLDKALIGSGGNADVMLPVDGTGIGGTGGKAPRRTVSWTDPNWKATPGAGGRGCTNDAGDAGGLGFGGSSDDGGGGGSGFAGGGSGSSCASWPNGVVELAPGGGGGGLHRVPDGGTSRLADGEQPEVRISFSVPAP
ncbi:hypothetical protein [Streptomyces sp. WAC06614]|uniref:hypothetical protein n=1 Tax=Streptomyces sp. WAC06614 TaxID=2487416 RepID=UPI000F78093A|nr:hypothetical protein [Streptomyces sp. WAC06614]RSS81151.1 hypothetical protein EF918_11185 [Streptomyces sp. WAC06614]